MPSKESAPGKQERRFAAYLDSLARAANHPREMAKKLTSRSTEFGYSIPLENGFGIIAGVYLDRTSEMAQSLGFDLHVVLGHTIAHEIGHLLLGTNSHAKVGVMRPTWGDREVRLANTGLLVFTEAQANLMQDQIARRFASVEAGQSNTHSGAMPVAVGRQDQ